MTEVQGQIRTKDIAVRSSSISMFKRYSYLFILSKVKVVVRNRKTCSCSGSFFPFCLLSSFIEDDSFLAMFQTDLLTEEFWKCPHLELLLSNMLGG